MTTDNVYSVCQSQALFAANRLKKNITIAGQTSTLTLSNTLDDRALFHRIATGDEAAFEIIFHRYLPKLKPFIFGIVKVEEVAEELLQDIFLKIWLDKENLIYIQQPSAWLYKIASNSALNQLKKQAIEYKNIKEAILLSNRFEETTLEKLNAKQLQELIYEAINQLPEKRRKIYLLTREQGLSHKEIAEKLKISVSTVKNQVITSLKHIQDHIQKRSGIYIPLILLAVKINLIMS